MVVTMMMPFIAGVKSPVVRTMVPAAALMMGVSPVVVMLEIVNMLAGPVLHAIQFSVLTAGNRAIVLCLVLVTFDSFLFTFQVLSLVKCQFAADDALVNPVTLPLQASVGTIFGKGCASGYQHKNARGNQYFNDMLFHCHTSLMWVSCYPGFDFIDAWDSKRFTWFFMFFHHERAGGLENEPGQGKANFFNCNYGQM